MSGVFEIEEMKYEAKGGEVALEAQIVVTAVGTFHDDETDH